MAYNGWTNYETWNVNLWLDNEEGSYHEKRRIISEAKDKGDAANTIKEWVANMAPDLGASMFSDLLSAALGEVDWYEIAEADWDELHEDDEKDEDEAANG